MLKRRWGQRLKIVLFFLIAAAFFKAANADKWTSNQIQSLSREIDRKYTELQNEINKLKVETLFNQPNLSDDISQLKTKLDTRLQALEQHEIDRESKGITRKADRALRQSQKLSRKERLFKEIEALSSDFKDVNQRVEGLQSLINKLEDSNLNLSQEDIEKLRFLIDDVVSN